MSTEIIVALIALAGVVISVVISVLTTEKVTRTDLQKLRTEIQQTYAGKLLEKRLEVYPDVYYLLSDFGKKIQYANVSKEYLEEFRNRANELNSKYSIFYSGDTNELSYQFRTSLDELIILANKESQEEFWDALRRLRHAAGHFELSLKSDLGIFVVEFSDPQKRFTTYTDLTEEVLHRNSQKHAGLRKA